MNQRDYKRANKPSACTLPPWAIHIPPKVRADTLRQIRQECIDIYGHSFDECSKRKICITKSCMGRPLPWKSKTAKPFLEQLVNTHKLNDSDELLIGTNCDICPIKPICTSVCNQVTDFIDRKKSAESTVYIDEYLEKVNRKKVKDSSAKLKFTISDLPWDCLNEREQLVVKEYYIEQRDYRYVAEKFGFYNQAASKYFICIKLNKLAKFAAMRLFLAERGSELNTKHRLLFEELYIKNKKQKEVVESLGYSAFYISQQVKRIKLKYNIRWHTFVRRKKGKTIYSILEVMR